MESFFVNAPALWFLALSGVILALYLLRLKRRRMTMSSVLLFEKAVEEFQANAPFQWLKKNLLLLLQLIVLALLVLALSRPFFSAYGAQSKRTILLIDTSYSMLARDTSETRLEKAVGIARSAIRDMRQGEQAMLVALNDRPKVLTGLTPDKMELSRELAKLGGELGGAADIGDAFKLLKPMMDDRTRVLLLSDGGFVGSPEESLTAGVALDYVAVGGALENVGTTALNVSKRAGTDDFEIFVALSSTFKTPVTRTLRLVADGDILDQREVVIAPGRSTELTISQLPYISAPLTLSFQEHDKFIEDDSCVVVIPEKKLIPVFFVSDPDILFESALASDPSLDVVRVPPSQINDTDFDAATGVFIFNRCMPPTGVEIPMLVVAPTGSVGGVTPGEKVEAPRVVDWDESHPLMAFINPIDLRFASCTKARLNADVRVVLEGSDGALVAAGESGYKRYAVLLFDVSESDFPLRAAFPIFLHNTANWLSQSAQGIDPYNAAVGHTWKFRVDSGIEQATLTSPSGKSSSLAVRGERVGDIELNEIGLWKLVAGGKEHAIAVNLLDASESALKSTESFRIGENEIRTGARAISTREIYPWLICLAVLIILCEWYLYHQRNI